MSTFRRRKNAQLYSLLSDGTPMPMVVVAWICTILILIFGALPFVLKQRGSAH